MGLVTLFKHVAQAIDHNLTRVQINQLEWERDLARAGRRLVVFRDICTIVAITPEDASATVQDCDARLARLYAKTGTPSPAGP